MRSAHSGVWGDGLRRTELPANSEGMSALTWIRSAHRQRVPTRRSTKNAQGNCGVWSISALAEGRERTYVPRSNEQRNPHWCPPNNPLEPCRPTLVHVLIRKRLLSRTNEPPRALLEPSDLALAVPNRSAFPPIVSSRAEGTRKAERTGPSAA